MKQKDILKIAMLFIFALTTNYSFCQTTIVSNGFEGSDTWAISAGTPSINSNAGGSDTPSNARIKSGSNSWTINNGNETVEFASQSIVGKSNVKVLVYLSSTAGTSGNGADGADYIKVYANIDGTGFPTSADIQIDGNSNARWDYAASLTATTIAGTSINHAAPQGGTNANNYATLEITIPDGSTSVALKVEGKNNSGNEYWNIDDITLVGEVASTDTNVSFSSATSSVTENGTSIDVCVAITNEDTNPTSVELALTSETATNGTDYASKTYPITLTFPANSSANQCVTFTIIDDGDLEGDETIVLSLQNVSGGNSAVLGSTTQHTLTITDDEVPPVPNIVINEILADPTGIDANQDGTVSTTHDEFVELVNTDLIPHDLTGYTISDLISVQYTFGAVTLPAGASVVIFGGGNAPFTNIPGISDKGSGNGLSFNNTGDTVTLKNSSGDIIATYSYGSEANSDESIGRNEDLTGTTLVKHETILTNPVLASPGRYNVSNVPFTTNTWKGITNNDWDTASNWSTGVTPTSGDDVHILKVTNGATASSAITVNSMIINHGASFIAQSTVTGNITYNRTLTADASSSKAWHSVSSPVTGQTVADFMSNHTLASGSVTASNRGIASYNNATPAWNYYQDGYSGTDSFDTKGYVVKLVTAGNVAFTGTYTSGDKDFTIAQGAGNNYNLVGNPFTAFVNVGSFFSDNAAANRLDEQTLYIWDPATEIYVPKLSGTDDSFEIAPGQGFFVTAGTASSNKVTITATNQSHQSDTFLRNSRTEIVLNVAQADTKHNTEIYYLEGVTKGFDNGYDGSIFSDYDYKLAIYTQLVENNQGKNLAVQSVPKSDLETTIVPLGIIAKANEELTFTADALNIPSGVYVFLEDRQEGVFTNLNEINASYKVTLTEAANGIGRFYLHTSNSALGVTKIDATNISIYAPNSSTLKIVGLEQGETSLKMFTILGKQIVNTSFNSNGVKEIALPKLALGVYLVQLKSATGTVNKKIILE
ncbi:lamin tail domain-containing protein [Polaribacter sp.]|uniref:lamin tail domain-containing protein n=1 Tax=Polaribacter sp. TaxID=1920175 RepID=UPI003EF3B42C